MRVIVMLRPTNKRGTKMPYTAYRKRLISEGFIMLQPEVFMRVSPTRAAANHLLGRISLDAPQTGAICALILTEKQYGSIHYITGDCGRQEALVGAKVQIEL